MFFIYQILTFIVLLLSPIIIVIRIIKNKESKSRFIEKFTLFTKKRKSGRLIWFHVASVGELMSILALVKNLERDKKIKTILITSSTLSSSIIFKKLKLKKTIHQFFPLDLQLFSLRFINYWKPSICIFIDSEIWPNMFKNIKSKSIPLVLMNGRITKKSFKKWNIVNSFAKNIFGKIDIAYPQNKETLSYLKKFKVKKIKDIGNLKFSQQDILTKNYFPKSYSSQFKNRIIFTAVSTHPGEEIIISKMHKILKRNFSNLLTIIIPRHIERVNEIEQQINELNLSVIIKSTNTKINNKTDILLVDSYGEIKKYFPMTKLTFVGGSLIKHGGQNPIEPANFNLNILHGPNVQNFKEIYKFFKSKKITSKVSNLNDLVKKSMFYLNQKNKVKVNLNKIGKVTLQKALGEINKIINHNEIKKT